MACLCSRRVRILSEQLRQHRPDIYNACQSAMNNTTSDLDFIRIDKTAFELCPDDSIDYAVMEKTSHAMVVPMDANWSDIGSWSALWEIEDKDDNGNVSHGDTISVGTTNSYINAQDKLVTTVGLDNVVIVETKDAILVADKSEVQQVKDIVNILKTEKRSEVSEHREVYRPWGKYDSLDNGQRFKVKRITVKPGARLSTQMHHHRAEHWIVVTGTAKVVKDKEEVFLTENQSTYIPVGSVHSLENPGMVDLELIEVQSGGYLGEDDIVRFDDKYGRELTMAMACFKTYDIRGRLGDEINDDIAYRIGRAFGLVTAAKSVVIGGDARATSPSLTAALAKRVTR